MGLGIDSWLGLGSFMVGITAVFFDLKYRKIPNWLTLPAIVLGIILNLAFNHQTWHFSLSGVMVGFLLLALPFILGGIGAGDVKLLMALGAFLGVKAIVWVGIYAGIAGGIMSLMALLLQDGFFRAKHRLVLLVTSIWDKDIRQIVLRPQIAKLTIPYGVAIFIGLLAGLIWGPLWE